MGPGIAAEKAMKEYIGWLMVPILGAIFIAWGASPGTCQAPQPSQVCRNLAAAYEAEARLPCGRGCVSAGPTFLTGLSSEKLGPKLGALKKHYDEAQKAIDEAHKAIDKVKAQMASEGIACICGSDPWQCRAAQPREVELCKQVIAAEAAARKARTGVPWDVTHNQPIAVSQPTGTSFEVPGVPTEDRLERIRAQEKVSEEIQAKAAAEGIECGGFEAGK